MIQIQQHCDATDAFPNDPSEWADTDDGLGIMLMCYQDVLIL